MDSYCLDVESIYPGRSTDENPTYHLSDNLDSYYSKDTQSKYAAVLLNSFPNVSLSELQLKSGISDLTIEEAIMGTQITLWILSGSEEISIQDYEDNTNIILLFEYLSMITPRNTLSDELNINPLNPSAEMDASKNLLLTFDYEIVGDSYEDSDITVAARLAEQFKSVDPNSVVNINGKQVTVTVPEYEYDPLDENIDLLIEFSLETVIEDVNYLVPVSDDSIQVVGGVWIGSKEVVRDKTITFTIPESTPVDPIDPVDPNDNTLPKTGTANINLYLIMTSIILMGIGTVLLISDKKEEYKFYIIKYLYSGYTK